MAMMVQGSDEIADEAVPVADLAMSMRLPDGYDAVPGQVARLRSRLRAAIVTVERRTGRALIARTFTLEGTAPGGRGVPLPIGPVAAVTSAEVRSGTGAVPLSVDAVEGYPHRPVAMLRQALVEGSRITMTMEAGYSVWAQVPEPLREAVLHLAEALDMGEADATPRLEGLIAPYRRLRIGGRG